jgi:hypothetical protein
MVDIHTHVLQGLDDGAGTLEEGFEMLKLAPATSSTDLVATPHSNAQFEFDEDRIDLAFRALPALSAGVINLHRGCDCRLTLHNLETRLSKLEGRFHMLSLEMKRLTNGSRSNGLAEPARFADLAQAQ